MLSVRWCRYREQQPCGGNMQLVRTGSLVMWKDYFGPQAKIYGVDINPRCQSLEEERYSTVIW